MSTPNLDSRYVKPADVSAAIAAQATTDAGQYASLSILQADYVVSMTGSTITAKARTGSNLVSYSGTDASTVIQSAISALTPAGSRGSGGGHIYITRGTYALTNELIITGWEGIAGSGGSPDSQLKISGDGYATLLSQNTNGKNGLVVKNLANFSLTDIRIYTGANAKSALLGDDSGAQSEMSCWRSYINNVELYSASTSSPAVYLKNFFALTMPTAAIGNTANHGLVIENTSTTTGYGNSHFGYLAVVASASAPYAGLVLRRTNAGGSTGLLTFENLECNGAYYGIYTKGANYVRFNFVDLEANQVNVMLDSVDGGDNTRYITIADGYMLPRSGGTAISNTSSSGGNVIRSYIECSGTQIPLNDTQQYLPPNDYDLMLSSSAAISRITMTSPARHKLRIRNVDGSISERFPAGIATVTPTTGDSSTAIATTAFVANAVTAAVSPPAADYIITNDGTTITATPRTGSGLSAYAGASSTQTTTVIQNAINALTPTGGGSGAGGGHIHITRGTYFINAQIVINGWEPVGGFPNPQSQLLITGDGESTILTQNNSGQNGIVIKNGASFGLRDFRMYAGSTAKSCILLDDTGTSHEMSSFKSVIDNVRCESNSTSSPTVYMKNFMDLSIGSMHANSSANHGILIENTSTSTKYGNSDFKFISANGSSSTGFAGIKFLATGANAYPNLITISHLQSVGSSYYGVYSAGLHFSRFDFIDIEGAQYPVYFDGTSSGEYTETRSVTIADGYIQPTSTGTAITNTLYTGGNAVKSTLNMSGSAIPITDAQQYRPKNTYDLIGPGASYIALNTFADSGTPFTIRSGDNTITSRLAAGTTLATTPTAGDNSTKIATTAFVTSAISTAASATSQRLSGWEPYGGGATGALSAINLNSQGTATARNPATTNYYTRTRRLGYVSGTGSNALAGQFGTQGFLNGVDGYTARFVFGLPAYNVGHGYVIGLHGFYGASSLPSAQTGCLQLYADPGDTTWKILAGGGTTGTPVNLGANFPVNTSATDIYDVTFIVPAGGASANYSITRVNTAQTVTGTYSVSMPTTNTFLNPSILANATASGVAAQIDLLRIAVTTTF